MTTIEIPWGDGSGDKIYLTSSALEGNQTVSVSSDANTGNVARTKDITFSASGAPSVILRVTQAEGYNLIIATYSDVYPVYNDVAGGYKESSS